MSKKIKLSEWQKKIVKIIKERGSYKPTYNDNHPSVKKLEALGVCEWNPSYTGLILTELGKSIEL